MKNNLDSILRKIREIQLQKKKILLFQKRYLIKMLRWLISFIKFAGILRRRANCGDTTVIYGWRRRRGSISLAITADLIMELNRDEPYFHLDRRLEGVRDFSTSSRQVRRKCLSRVKHCRYLRRAISRIILVNRRFFLGV